MAGKTNKSLRGFKPNKRQALAIRLAELYRSKLDKEAVAHIERQRFLASIKPKRKVPESRKLAREAIKRAQEYRNMLDMEAPREIGRRLPPALDAIAIDRALAYRFELNHKPGKTRGIQRYKPDDHAAKARRLMKLRKIEAIAKQTLAKRDA